MKRIFLLAAASALCTLMPARAQDAATEERLNQLSGKIEDLIAGQRAQQKQIDGLLRELESLRAQASRPSGEYASQEDLKRITEAVKEVDRKRMEDAEKISTQLSKLGQKLSSSSAPPKKNPAATPSPAEKVSERGYPYTIKSGDTLSVIVQAYREKNIKITTDQILKANPGLKPEKLKVGQEIWIPAPQS